MRVIQLENDPSMDVIGESIRGIATKVAEEMQTRRKRQESEARSEAMLNMLKQQNDMYDWKANLNPETGGMTYSMSPYRDEKKDILLVDPKTGELKKAGEVNKNARVFKGATQEDTSEETIIPSKINPPQEQENIINPSKLSWLDKIKSKFGIGKPKTRREIHRDANGNRAEVEVDEQGNVIRVVREIK